MNYGQLKTHFDALLNRSDITTALTEQFINDGIARIQRSLRTPMQEKILSVAISTATASLTLPADFLETISLYFDQYELQRVPMKRFRELNKSNYTGNPMFYTREGPNLLLFPQPSTGTLVLYYYAEMPALVNASDETPMTQVASNLIIYAALTFASDYYLDERGELFELKYNQLLNEHQEMANDQEMNGGTQVIQPAYSYTDY
tara:strand:- start:1934 stop:2545 length:612 start_codon:yes stop_codon:yes gene_type:complete